MRRWFDVLRMTAALSFRAYPAGAVVLQVLIVLSAVAVAVIGLAQRWIVDASGQHRVAGVLVAAGLGALALAFVNVAGAGGSSIRGEIHERVELLLTERILAMTSALPTTEHLVRPDYLDRIRLLRTRAYALAATCWTVSDVAASVVSVCLSVVLLAGVHPALALVALFGIPPILVIKRAQRITRRAAEDTAEASRREQRLHGQWQKLALARGLMRDTPLLMVLDEPTAALDPQAEHDLFERFIAQARAVAAEHGTITVLVSHRFSTVHMADHIVVIGDGRIAEQGTHAELMARDGIYAELFQTQARAYA